jgi:hypothetical protein
MGPRSHELDRDRACDAQLATCQLVSASRHEACTGGPLERQLDLVFKEERMNRTAVSNAVFGWALAIACSAVACGGSQSATDANRAGQPPAPGAAGAGTAQAPGGTAAEPQKPSPITLTGCLQKGDGRNDFILTEVNTTRTPVGTSGSAPSASNDAVGQAQMRSAAHAYRLNGDRDSLEGLVGKQVRVSGMLAERSEVSDRARAGTTSDKDRTKIDQDDLARVDVASVDSVADTCGGDSRSR